MRTGIKNITKPGRLLLLADFINALIILLLAYAAASKLWDYYGFAQVLDQSPLLKPYANVLTWALPALEWAIVVLLLLPITRLRGLYVSAGLLIAFALYLSYMVLFAPHLPCGCGGVLKSLSWRQHIFFNLFFVGLAFAAIYIYRRYKTTVNESPP